MSGDCETGALTSTVNMRGRESSSGAHDLASLRQQLSLVFGWAISKS